MKKSSIGGAYGMHLFLEEAVGLLVFEEQHRDSLRAVYSLQTEFQPPMLVPTIFDSASGVSRQRIAPYFS